MKEALIQFRLRHELYLARQYTSAESTEEKEAAFNQMHPTVRRLFGYEGEALVGLCTETVHNYFRQEIDRGLDESPLFYSASSRTQYAIRSVIGVIEDLLTNPDQAEWSPA